MDKEQILELSQRLLTEMFIAERCLKCEKILSEKIANGEEIIHDAFFKLARHSFLYTGTIILCKAFEGISTKNRPISIEQIFQWTECTLKLTEQQRQQLEKFRNEYSSKDTVKRLRTQRDKFYAHNDRISPEDLADESGLTRSEKLKLINFALRALSFVIGVCTGEPCCYRDGKDESSMRLELVLNDLEEYHKVIKPWMWEQIIRSIDNDQPKT